MSSTTLSNMKHIVQTTLDGLNAWDYSTVVSIRSEDFTFQALPLSLGQKSINVAEFKELWDNLLTPTFKSFEIQALDKVFDVDQQKAVVHTHLEIDTAAGPFSYGMVQFYTFNNAGDRLTRLEEFFDSKAYLDVTAAVSGDERWEGEVAMNI